LSRNDNSKSNDMERSNYQHEFELLRKKAEELLKKRTISPDSPRSEVEILKLIHELEVHQIELELQNEELTAAKNQQQEAAAKYIDLYDYAPTGYFTLSKNGQITKLNYRGAAILGKPRPELLSRHFRTFITEEAKSHFNQFLKEIFENETKQTCETTVAGNGDSPTWVHITGKITADREHCHINATDITRLKLTEAELTKAKEKAEENDRLKSAFLANMSHEIRTPMNGILGFTELLKDPKLKGKQQKEYIRIIEKSGEHLLTIINDIINISKVESGQMEISISTTNINEQIEYLYHFFMPEIKKKGILFSFQNSLPNEEAFVKTDQDKVDAILINLTKNAIKFTQTGAIEMGYEKKGSYLEFFVKDTGIGISEDKSEIIFERFRHSHDLSILKQEGAGLGLSISRAYVEMLGGKIWVKSEPGKGSTFYFTIPYEKVDEDKNQTNILMDERTPIKDLKILIVEDDNASEVLLQKIIQLFEKETIKATTGIEAVEICRNNPDIDLVLMDIQIPEMDGYEATRQIRQFNRDVIIIAQTAFGLDGDREKSIEAGCNAHISKPYNRTLLIRLLRKYFTTELSK